MRKDYSAPVVTTRPARSTQKGGQQAEQEKKRVDYTHLDIIAEAERIIERRLVRHTRTSGKYKCQCPFDGCSSKQDAFLVYDRPELEEGQVHYWCNRCDRRGSLIDLLKELKGYTFKEACEDLRIDPRTWRAVDDGDQGGQAEQQRSTARARRGNEREQQRKAEQAEIDLLGAWYIRARAWLAAGQVTMKDGRQIALDQARAYLQERGFSLDQARALGLAYIPTVKELPEIAGEQKLEYWRGRILFPLAGPKGATGYAGRTLRGWKPGMPAEQHKKRLDAWNEKYKGEWAKQVQRYYKTRQAAYYGYDDACRASTLVIVEGEFDAASIRLALGDMPDIAVCAFGKSFQARLVPLNVLRVVLALDGDQAGQEAIASHTEELEARGVEVTIARPPAGKDWNDCLLLAGLDAIRAAIAACTEVVCSNLSSESGLDRQVEVAPLHIAGVDPNDDRGDACVACGRVPDLEDESAYFICEDRASVYWGDLYCMPCWQHMSSAEPIREIFDGEINGAPVWPEPYTVTLLPAGMSSAEYIERYTRGERPGRVIHPAMETDQSRELVSTDDDQIDHRCRKHGKPLAYSDEMGGRYCDHVDCWERYRLIRAGARRGYAALAAVIDPRDYLADTSASPVRYTASGLPIYPALSAIRKQIIAAGADAWRDYVKGQEYWAIDQAVKALASA